MSARVTIELRPLGRKIRVRPGAPLREPLAALGIELPCGGRGRCRRCRVRVLEGELPASVEEVRVLTPAEREAGWRLACRSRARGPAVLEVEQHESVILTDHRPARLARREGLGVAVDVGTTTLAAQLLDLRGGRVIAVEAALNPQVRYGADIMSRVQTAREPQGRRQLVHLLRRAVGGLVRRALRAAAATDLELVEIVLVGNSVMHHLFCGLDVEPLARVPFETPAGGLRELRAREVGWWLTGDPPVRFLPCLGGFVGSDVLAGILATGVHERPGPELLLDLGTNGEVALACRGRVLVASTAAGPAFEGGAIAQGMRAGRGAIDRVWAESDRLHSHVIGGGAARGICGSGIVDAVAAALDLGWLDPSGRLARDRSALELAPGVRLTQADIRQLQLAKAAIGAGVRLLLARAGLGPDRVERVHLAGAFGHCVDPRSARRIGLIPVADERIESVGNTALLGAKQVLAAGGLAAAGADELAGRVEHVALAAETDFAELFVRETAFPPPG